jgi:Arc/MetJ family transcription regulator
MPYDAHDAHTVDVDERALDAARRELGTKGVSETVNAALLDVVRDIDGTPQEVAAGRERGRAAWHICSFPAYRPALFDLNSVKPILERFFVDRVRPIGLNPWGMLPHRGGADAS